VQRCRSLQSSAPAQIASIPDVERYYAFRQCVEVGAAGIAATAREEEDIALMRHCLQALRRAQLEGQTGVEEDLALHMAIARATRNPFFISTIEHALGPIRQCMELAQNLGSPQEGERIQVIDDEHQAIIDAIAQVRRQTPRRPCAPTSGMRASASSKAAEGGTRRQVTQQRRAMLRPAWLDQRRLKRDSARRPAGRGRDASCRWH
jgi:hypothetical protein